MTWPVPVTSFPNLMTFMRPSERVSGEAVIAEAINVKPNKSNASLPISGLPQVLFRAGSLWPDRESIQDHASARIHVIACVGIRLYVQWADVEVHMQFIGCGPVMRRR